MFNTPPHTSRDNGVTSVRTRRALKKEQTLEKQNLTRDIQSEIFKKEYTEKDTLAKRPETDIAGVTKIGNNDKPVSIRKSCSSLASVEARKKLLEYEAAKAKAELQAEAERRVAEMKKNLIEKKLEADLAALEVQSRSNRSASHRHSELCSAEKVQQWLERSHVTETNNVQPEFENSGTEIKNLVSAIYQTNIQNKQLMSRIATSKDLPQFSGDSFEWLAFKQAYDESTKFCKYSDAENMWRLRKSVRGEAKETVSSLLIGNTTPHAVIEALELRYGRPETIIHKISYQLKKISPLSQNYHQEIVPFAIKIKNYVAAVQAVKKTEYLRGPELVSAILSKFPNALINKWADYYNANYHSDNAKLEVLAEFLFNEANKISNAGLTHIHCQADFRKKPEDRKQHSVNSVLLSEKNSEPSNCKFCRVSNHKLSACARFKRAMTKDRWRFVRANRLCHKCLTASHSRDTCPAAACSIDECTLPHHNLLHWKRSKPTSETVRKNSEKDRESPMNDNSVYNDCSGHNATVAHTHDRSLATVVLKVVPVKIKGPRGSLTTYALLDDGATVSLISADIAERVGLNGYKQKLCVRGAWDSELVCNSEIITCEVINTNNNKPYELCARKINELNLPIQKLSNIKLENYKHLKNMFELLPCVNVKPKLLIGQDNYHLIAPLKTIISSKNAPCATLTQLGWCVHDVCPNQENIKSTECALLIKLSCNIDGCRHDYASHCIAAGSYLPAGTHTGADRPTTPLDSPRARDTAMECDCLVRRSIPNGAIHTDRENDERIHDLVRKSFMFESIGVNNKPRQHEDELKAINIVDNTAVLRRGRWEVGLPWRNQNAQMADSYCNAYRRLKMIERKMSLNEEYAIRYKERVLHLLANNYAKRIEKGMEEEKIDRIWYIPHFGVDNPNKRKLRLVFDAAATSAGHSLNDYLLPGPNLLESLLGIMLRFRERPIGLTGDIKDMFLRIKIRTEDQHALRFLWRDDMQRPIEKFVMNSLIFCANCAPFIAQHIKNKNALRFEIEMPEAVQAILKNHFMDDYIDCFDNIDDALKTMKEVSFIHQQGGFEMRDWTSNESKVCRNMPKETLSASAVRFKVEQDDQSERILGLLWYPNTDTFGFNLSLQRIPTKVLTCEKRPTKRELLRIVMSIFDIYGLLTPFTIKAKILMQNCWKSDLNWDDEINTTHFEVFCHWIAQLHELKKIRIPRWYFRLSNHNTTYTRTHVDETLQVHVFCDASPSAYAAVAYYRAQPDEDVVCVSFIASKSRVAPIKPVTIPRLKLQAAVLACRLADTIMKEHRLKPIRRYFWCDSMTVLHWIRNKSRTYNIFIANCLGEIDDLSSTDEWHYVPTNQNIADIATKSNSYKLERDCEWFRGPKFLYKNAENWFISPPETETLSISEEKLENVHHVHEIENSTSSVPDIDKFSSWLRLLRCTATVLLFMEKCKKTCKTEIDTDLLQRAEILLLHNSQSQSFAVEIELLKNNKPIQSNSRLRTLTPYLDEFGLLRVGGRVGAASDVTSLMKNPIILDGRQPIARLITKSYHIKCAHGNNESVVNELRQKYWLLNLRPTVRSVASRCLLCRIRKAVPLKPRMADLPEARLAHNTRPFTHCGVDLFGPMEVTVGRRRERRYGVLLTCMTIRAIHIELVSSLTTDSFIMALRRMAARRGWPQNMYSDNGTNLRGADVELRSSYQELDQTTLKEEMTNRGVEWSFNSPVSPHKGGAWERLIRSVKTALKVVLKERAPREETLATLLIEIENIVNSRPLTHVSVDPESMEALTPNHFLIGSSSNLPVPGVFDDGDLYLRKMWRIAQRLADMFWQRWVKEVLPTLIPRQKWYQENENLKPGSLVIIVDPNLPRNTWPKGIVEKVYPGRDGRIRTVDVRTKTGVLTRPVHRLALLPLAD